MDAPNDLAEASGYQGFPRQRDRGPLWLSYRVRRLLSFQKGLALQVTGMSEMCHSPFIQENASLDTCSVQGIVKR